MNFKQLAIAPGILALVALSTRASAEPTYSLDFSSATPGTLLDRNGLGTGFTHRLANTGGVIDANDPNLLL